MCNIFGTDQENIYLCIYCLDMLKTYLRETKLFPFSQDTNQEELYIKKGVTLLVAMQDSCISRSQNSRGFKEIKEGKLADFEEILLFCRTALSIFKQPHSAFDMYFTIFHILPFLKQILC